MEENENDRLIELYYHQFIYGCDLISCTNPFCAHCPKFILASKSDQEKYFFAKSIVQTHINKDSLPQLCSQLNLSNFDPAIIQTQADFYDYALQLNDSDLLNISKNLSKYKEIVLKIRPILSNFSLFSNMFLTNTYPLSYENSAISDTFMFNFSSKLSEVPQLSSSLRDAIYLLSKQIIQQSKNPVPSYSFLRSLILVFYFPVVLSPACSDSMLIPLFSLISNLPKAASNIFEFWLSQCPNAIRQMVGAAHFIISLYYSSNLNPKSHSSQIIELMKGLSYVNEANLISDEPFSPQLFYNHHIDESIDSKKELKLFQDPSKFSFLETPFILSMKTKAAVCQYQSQELMGQIALRSFFMSVLDSNQPQTDVFLTLHIRRAHLLEDAISQLQLNAAQPYSFLKKLKVVFEGESAVDV